MKTFQLSLALAVVAISLFVAYLFQIHYLALPIPKPALPASAYDESRLSAKKAQFRQLADDYRYDPNRVGTAAQFAKRVGNKYEQRFEEILGKGNSPEDLAMLALWAYKQPGFWGDCIYNGLFFGNIALLGEMKGDRAKYALSKIRQQVQLDGHFDGYYAESIVEAEEQQNKLQ